MKNLLAKLKSLNYKQAAIDHGEKLILGMVGLFVLICLGGTSWSRYDKQPKEFLDKVDSGTLNIKNSAFTLEERNKYKPMEIMQAALTLQSALEPGRYEYSTDWFHPMYPSGIKVSEPKWFAPIEAIADFGKAVIIELPQEQAQSTMLATTEGSEEAKKLADDEDNEFALKRPTNDGAGRSGLGADGAGNSGGGVGASLPGGATAGDAAGVVGAGAAPAGYKNFGGAGAGMEGMMGGYGKSGQSAPTVNARGNRFVSVRAVFPLGDQLEELVKTMHENKLKLAESAINFVDFEVERQVAQAGDKSWSGPWEKVDLQATLDLLDRIEFDADIVDPAYTDNVFTMPLPHRAVGKWKGKTTDWASHPLIKTMTDAQAELQAHLNEKLVEEAAKRKLEDKTSKKGFASKLNDVGGMRRQMSGQQLQGLMGDMGRTMKEGGLQSYNPSFAGADGMKELGDAMTGFTEQLGQSGSGRLSKYLLFRYFDFQVTPGNAYRYRVRLTLLNPNFKRAVEDLVDESIAAGELRVTPWSDPTPHVFVPDEQRIFLAKAEKPRPDTGLPSANLDVFQWFSEAGTTIAAKVEKLQLGQFIGGRIPKTEVYRPANDTLKEEDVPVFTGSLLADVAAAPTTIGFDLVEHVDLKLDDKKLKQLTSADKALVVDRYGQMAILDTKTAADERSASESVVEKERRDIRARLKDKPAENVGVGGDLMMGRGGDGDGLMGMPGGGGMSMPGMGGGEGLRKGKNPKSGKRPGGGAGAGGKGKGSSGSGSGPRTET